MTVGTVEKPWVSRGRDLLLASLLVPAIGLPEASMASEHALVQMVKGNATRFAIGSNLGASNSQSVHLLANNSTNENQLWYEIDRGNGYYSYQKKDTNHCLDGGNGAANGQSVYLWQCGSANKNQHWRKVDVGNGKFRLEKRNAPRHSIDGNRNGANGQRVYLWNSSNTNGNQQWAFTTVQPAGGPITVERTGPGPHPHTFIGGGGHVAGALPVGSCAKPGGFRQVNSIQAMIAAGKLNNQRVVLKPGTYTVNNNMRGLFTPYSYSQLPLGRDGTRMLFAVTGNNNILDFRCTKINFKSELFAGNGNSTEIIQLWTGGNNNKIRFFHIEDIGETVPSGGAISIVMDGRDNLVTRANVTTRGSSPYGLGDAFGKGSGSTISLRKHAAVLLRGVGNSFVQSTVYSRAFGHGIFMQGARDVLIDSVYVQGEIRKTNSMLAANNARFSAADQLARNVGYQTVWGYPLPGGHWLSLSEDGIRAYPHGFSLVDGQLYEGGTTNVTVRNSVVRHMRSGLTLSQATGEKYVENTTLLANETGFSFSSGQIVRGYADTNIGPALTTAYQQDRELIAEIILLGRGFSGRNGWGAAAFIGGSNHNITFRSAETQNVNQNRKIYLAGPRFAVRNLQDPQALELSGSNINNYTKFPVLLHNTARDNTIVSSGAVSGRTDLNTVQ